MFSKRNPSRDGRWTKEEHELFMKGLAIHGRSWTKVADVVKTRSTVQVRSHAQKFEMKAAKRAQRALAAQARSRKQEGGDIAGFTENIYEGTSCAFDLTDYEHQDPYDISGKTSIGMYTCFYSNTSKVDENCTESINVEAKR